MDFEPNYTLEQESFRQEVRAWLSENVPSVHGGDHESLEDYEKLRELGRRLGERGWLRPTLPAEYGGGGFDVDRAIVLYEEVDRFDLDLPPYYDSGGIFAAVGTLAWGTEDQKRRLLPPIMKGLVTTWQLLTGPENGSDLAGCRTDAIRDGDEYVVNGTKIFVGGTVEPDQHWVLTCTDPSGSRHDNLSFFIIPHDLPGISVSRMKLLGHPDSEGRGETIKNIVYFDNVRVPAEYLIGGENNGWQVARTHLEWEHGGQGSVRRNRWFERTIERAKTLQRAGRPLLEHRRAKDLLAEIYMLTETQRLFNLRNFWLNRTRREISYEGSQASYYRKTSNLQVTHRILELLGGYSLTNDPKFDPSGGQFDGFIRGAIVALHTGGTADIQKVIMARRIGIGRSERERMARNID